MPLQGRIDLCRKLGVLSKCTGKLSEGFKPGESMILFVFHKA